MERTGRWRRVTCGHGTIALATWAADAGLVAADAGEFSIDVPSGRIGVQVVKAAEPDGNTLLITPIAPMVIYPSIYPQLAYDPCVSER